MFGVGIYSIVNLQRFGQFTQNTYVAGAAIFVGVGVLKFVFGLLGILALYWQKKPLTITVRERERGRERERECVCVCEREGGGRESIVLFCVRTREASP